MSSINHFAFILYLSLVVGGGGWWVVGGGWVVVGGGGWWEGGCRVAYDGSPRETTGGALETTGDHSVQFPRTDPDTNTARTDKATLVWGNMDF